MACLKQKMQDKLIEHRPYINAYGQHMPEIHNWTWGTNKVFDRIDRL